MIRYGLLALFAGLIGAGVLHFVGPFHIADSVTMRIVGGILRGILVAVVVTIVYVALLAKFDTRNFQLALGLLGTRIPPLRRFAPQQPATETPREEPDADSSDGPNPSEDPAGDR